MEIDKDVLVEIFFNEDNNLRKLKGNIVGEDEIFIHLQTFIKIYKINKTKIVKIEIPLKEVNKNESYKV